MRLLMTTIMLFFISLPRADVLVNQSGYDRDESKRFTAPGAADQTPFAVKKANDHSTVFTGQTAGQKGDFSEFKPGGADEFYVEVEGHGKSFTFIIAPFFFHSQTARQAYQFFMDARLGVKSITTTKDGGPSRDAGAWNRETFFEALLYASNPALFDRWDFESSPEHSEFSNNGIPDLIDIMLWHAEFCYRYRESPPPGQNKWDYENAVEQLAAACVAYHWFLKDKGWMSEETYNKYLDWCLQNWSKHELDQPQDLDDINRVWKDTPGHKILPNLMLKEVGLIENRFEGAIKADFAIEEIIRILPHISGEKSNNDGERDYTHIGGCCGRDIPFVSLAYAKHLIPDLLPMDTIQSSLEKYRENELFLTQNLWDFRRSVERDTAWKLERDPYVNWSTAGMVAGYPTAVISADYVLGEQALRPLAFSAVDYMFGRNPCNAHFSSNATDPELGFIGADNDWVCDYGGGSGKLKGSRSMLSGAPWDLQRKKKDGVITWEGESPFPYNPSACERYNGWKHCESWVVYQRQLLTSVAFSTLGQHSITLSPSGGQSIPEPGDDLQVRLYAALNVDWDQAETVEITITGQWDKSNDKETIILTETSVASSVFESVVETKSGEATPGNGILEVSENENVSVSYGYTLFEVKDNLRFNQPVSNAPIAKKTNPRIRWRQVGQEIQFSVKGIDNQHAVMTVYRQNGDKIITARPDENGLIRLHTSYAESRNFLQQGYYFYTISFDLPTGEKLTRRGKFFTSGI